MSFPNPSEQFSLLVCIVGIIDFFLDFDATASEGKACLNSRWYL